MNNGAIELPFNTEDVLGLLRSKICTFVTITLKPKLYKFSSITQLELTNNEVYNCLYRCSDNYIIVAEHTKQGNVHYHAVVDFKDKYQSVLCLNMLKKIRTLGFIKLDQDIQSIIKCAEYMTKELYETMKIFTSTRGHKPNYYMNNHLWRELTEK